MVRTQLLLDEEQHRRLKQLSRSEGKSLSAVVRDILDDHFGRKEVDLAGLAGVVRDAPEIARDHDRWIYGSSVKGKKRKRNG